MTHPPEIPPAELPVRRRESDARLERTSELLRVAEAMGRIGGWEADLEAGTLFWTDETYRIHDLSPDEYLPTLESAVRFFAPESIPVITEAFRTTVKTGTGYDLELRLITATGRRIWVRTTCTTVRKNGRTLKVRGAFQDVTDRKEAELALRQSEERLAVAVRGAKAGLWDWDIGENIHFAPGFRDLLGYSADEFPDRLSAFLGALHPDDLPIVGGVFQAALRSPDVPFEVEYRLRTKAGRWIWCHARGELLRDESSRVYRLAGSTIDITERREAQRRLERTTELLNATQSMAQIGGWEIDPVAGTVFWTDETYRIHDTSPAEYTPTVESAIGFYAPESVPIITEAVQAALEHGQNFDLELELITARGRRIWVRASSSIVMRDGRPAVVRGALQDVTERKRAERSLSETRQQLESLIGNVAGVLYRCLDDADWTMVFVSDEIEAFSGRPAAEFLAPGGPGILAITHPEDRERVQATINEATRAGRPYTVEFRIQDTSGAERWVLDRGQGFLTEPGGRRYYDGVFVDITERKAAEQGLQFLADHDPLTGLWNRRRLSEEVERRSAEADRYGTRAALLVGDLDDFKLINDSLGHVIGDEFIRSVAGVLSRGRRDTDMLFRMGGDEFAAVLPSTSLEEAVQVAEGMCRAVKGHVAWPGGSPVSLTVSIGAVAIDRASPGAADALLAAADLAMYRAKRLGGDRVAVAKPEADRREAHAALDWAQRLRQALAGDRFELYAQPIFEVGSGVLVRREVLIRLRDGGELLMPSGFVRMAERHGLSGELDRWVIGRALAWMASPAGAAEHLAVNIAGPSLDDRDLLEFVAAQIAAFRLDPARLSFEITETAAISDLTAAGRFVEGVRTIGARVGLDDFGSGFGSFTYLKHLPVDYLKIDAAFVQDAVRDIADRTVIKAIVDVARGLGIATVAEHVDSGAKLEILTRLGVNFVQGFHLGRPEPLRPAD